MKHKKETHVTYTPNEKYYEENKYLGYNDYNDLEGCRRLFLFIVGMLTAMFVGALISFLV